MKNLRRLALLLVIILAPIVLLIASGRADSRAIEKRKATAETLRVKSDALRKEGASISRCLRELGQPSRVESRPGSQASGGEQPVAEELILTYEYHFRAMPWSRGYQAFVKLRFEPHDGSFKLKSTLVDQTFG